MIYLFHTPAVVMETAKILMYLDSCAFKFYLTGSRFFGNTTQFSDYDFCVEYSSEVETFLKSYSFKKDDNSYYCSAIQQTVAVYKNGEVHVQLIENVERKLKAQEFLLKTKKLNGVSKRSKTKISSVWNDAFYLVDIYSNLVK